MTTVPPLISICIPAYRRDYLFEAVASAAAQQIEGLEIVVTDNGPDDIGAALAAAAGDVALVYVHNGENIGMCANFRKALSLARGRYVTFLCADDLLYPGALQRLVAHLEAHPGMLFAGSQVEYVGVRSGGTNHRLPEVMTGRDYVVASMRRARNFMHLCTTTFRREAGLAVGIGDLLFFDWLFWLRLALRGEVGFIDARLGAHRYHERNETGQQVTSVVEECARLQEVFSALRELDEAKLQRQGLIRALRCGRRRLFARYYEFGWRQASGQGGKSAASLRQAFREMGCPWPTRLFFPVVPLKLYGLDRLLTVRRMVRGER